MVNIKFKSMCKAPNRTINLRIFKRNFDISTVYIYWSECIHTNEHHACIFLSYQVWSCLNSLTILKPLMFKSIALLKNRCYACLSHNCFDCKTGKPIPNYWWVKNISHFCIMLVFFNVLRNIYIQNHIYCSI